MADTLSPAVLNQITVLTNAVKAINELSDDIALADILFNDTPDYASQLTQAAIDEVSSLKTAGVTPEIVLSALSMLKNARVAMQADNVALAVMLAIR